MGEWFRCVVDRDATEEESPRLGESIRLWLVEEGIILPEASDCVLSDNAGYPPGPNYAKAVCAPDKHLLSLITNGLEIITKRTVFYSALGELELVCTSCAARCEALEAWHAAVDEWYNREGPGTLACLRCGKSQPIDEWEHDPPWGFADLGFNFWNWPPLTDEFAQRFAERLGHRVVLVAGKI